MAAPDDLDPPDPFDQDDPEVPDDLRGGRSPLDEVAAAEMLGNRLIKRARHLRKWARREGISCYRLYDRDIPEIPLAIDWYDGRVVLARYARNDEDLRGPGWLPEMAASAASALGVGAADLFVKERRRQRGLAQYERVDERNARFTVTEGGHRFWVNLSDYLDTGLFLDHRPTRAMVGAAAAGKRFLNLFSYTAAFTVHAARGGAERSVSVDLSRTYTDWAAANLALNEIDPTRHELIAADVDRWLDEARREGQRFDLAVVDPPTFSNSKRMQGVFDIERDHVDLLRATAALLAPGGVIYFSTNHRRFHLDEESLYQASLEVEDISARTIPPDYRDQKIHHCWILRRR